MKRIKKNNKPYISLVQFFAIVVGVMFGLYFFFTTYHADASCSLPLPTTAAGYQSLLRGSVNGKLYHGDFGASMKLPNGKILWVYGDTMISTSGATRMTSIVHNAALVTDNGCVSALTGPLDAKGKETTWITPNATTDVPNLDDYYWSSTPYMDGSTPHMFLSHMYNDASGVHALGTDLATFKMSNGIPVLQSIVKTPGSNNDGITTPTWGAGVYRDSSHTYIFGTTYTNTPWVWGHNYYLARVANGKVTNISSWRYWNGSSWVTTQSAAVRVIDEKVGVGAGISLYKKANGPFVLTTKKFDIVGSDIVGYTATNITGPWTEVTPALLSPVPPLNPPMSTSDFTYFGLGHPEILLPSGKLLVSWSVGSSDFSAFGDLRNGNYFGEVNQP